MRKGSIWRIVALLMALAMVAAACGDDTSDTTAAPAATTTTAAPAATTTTGAPAAGTTTTTETPMLVCDITIGLMLPITGGAAFIGEVQLNWAKYTINTWNAAHGSNVTFVEGDTMIDAAQGALIAPQFVDNSDIIAIVGPAGSDVVDAAGAILDPAGIAFISPSATRVGLAAKYDSAFRTVPTDDVQGPTSAAYMIEQGAKKVFLVDDQTSYSTGLAESITEALEAGGVEVISDSVTQDVIEFSSLVSTIPDDADFVYLPWQLAANGQIFSNQMAEQGKDITIFGSDGMDSGDFTTVGSILAFFAPPVEGVPTSAGLLADFLSKYPENNSFGPPVHVATTIILQAADRVCQAGETPTRANVLAEVRDTNMSDSILGTPISFQANGDLDGGQFFIMQIQEDGTKDVVG
jgi:branched-chain amino acid transport system substrate-binding protein